MKKFSLCLTLCFSISLLLNFSLIGCGCGEQAESKVFSNSCFEITATTDYKEETSKETQYSMVLSGKEEQDSIIIYFNRNTSNINTGNTSLETFTQDVIQISNFSVNNEDINDVLINQKEGYTNTKALYFTHTINKYGYRSYTGTDSETKYQLHAYQTYKSLVFTVKMPEAFVVGYINGKENTFDSNYSKYLGFLKSLIIKSPIAQSTTLTNGFNALIDAPNEFVQNAGYNIKLPSGIILEHSGEDGRYLYSLVCPKSDFQNKKDFGSITVSKKITTDFCYSVDGNSEYTSPILTYLGKNNKYLCYADETIENSEYGVNVDLIFRFVTVDDMFGELSSRKIADRIDFSFRIYVNSDTSSSSYDEYNFHSLQDEGINNLINYLEKEIFCWVQTIELI